jgi:tol-pal system protein YbgF
MKSGRLLLIPAFLLSACASKNDLNYVQGQVSELKQESRVIKEQSAGSYSEITQYREEIAALRGKIDELRHNYEISMRRTDMEDSLLVKKTDTLESRIARIEQSLAVDASGGGDSQTPKLVPSAPGSAAPGTGTDVLTGQLKGQSPVKAPVPQFASATDEALLNEGLVRMKKQDFTGARESFKAFMNANPKSPKVADAQFYMAESYFNEKWYEKAIIIYDEVFRRYTKNAKRPAARYKQGLSFEKLGDKANARTCYKDVVNLYPKSPEAKLAQKNLDKK